MLRRYVLLRDLFSQIKMDGLDEMLLKVRQNKTVDKLCLKFYDLDTVTKSHQSNSVSMADGRALFDEVIWKSHRD